ncbi:unnamed protein product [Soboliphyme baturini]|uniref:Delta-like protein n=1 Tax=Soboliphyme baturini TaxID=241478 RepID=A0A183INN8_9BILA|nr:unnamed protein product [Soboliphyme baturini]
MRTAVCKGKITVVIDFYHLEKYTNKQYLVFRSVKPLLIHSEVGDKWTVVEDGTNSSDVAIQLQYSVRVSCRETFYGPQCSRECEPRDYEFGHYNCSSDGTKVCLPGWTGLACMQAVCRDGCKGTCDKPFGCDNCIYGWTGSNCDVCQTSATCVHGYCHKPHQCICYNKWGGKDCDKDEDFCLHKKPCLNGGTCHNRNNDFFCVCAPGFTGRVCDIRNCHHMCKNGGKCIHFGNSSSECLCPAKYKGQFCERRECIFT